MPKIESTEVSPVVAIEKHIIDKNMSKRRTQMCLAILLDIVTNPKLSKDLKLLQKKMKSKEMDGVAGVSWFLDLMDKFCEDKGIK